MPKNAGGAYFATTLTQFTEIVETCVSDPNARYWFRGIGRTDHKLIPSLYRHPTIVSPSEIVEVEFKLLADFKHKSIPYQTQTISTEWEYLFLMQHFGVPTRLLDWTENPFIALYFAVVAAERFIGKRGAFSHDAAVWILNTTAWNSVVLPAAWKGQVISVVDSPSDGYKPTDDIRRLNVDPVAITGIYNSARIVAQRGAFTVFGANTTPMEDVYTVPKFPADSLIRVEIPKAALKQIRQALRLIGYTDTMIYPDLEGLARELKSRYNF